MKIMKGSLGQRRGDTLTLEKTVNKTDRQGFGEVSGHEEEVEEDPLPVYNPHSEEDIEDNDYYDTTTASDQAFIQYPLTLQ